MVDVARALGVSHGSVYRHFPSKAALRDAVAERWLAGISDAAGGDRRRGRHRRPSGCGAGSTSSSHSKRSKALEDPELFATYIELAAEAREVVRAHVDTLAGQLARIIADGVARGEFAADDPAAAARAVFDATARFHNPAHAAEWSDPGIDAAYEGVRALVLGGLRARRSRGERDEEGRPRVHPPARSRRAHGRVDTRPLPRPARRQAAPKGERDALHAAVLARHDPVAQSGDRRPTSRHGASWWPTIPSRDSRAGLLPPMRERLQRANLDSAVSIHAVERFLGDLALEQVWAFDPPPAPRGKWVLVIGAGPSGLSAAYHLARLGTRSRSATPAPSLAG